jgi:hypothetical protein
MKDGVYNCGYTTNNKMSGKGESIDVKIDGCKITSYIFNESGKRFEFTTPTGNKFVVSLKDLGYDDVEYDYKRQSLKFYNNIRQLHCEVVMD